MACPRRPPPPALAALVALSVALACGPKLDSDEGDGSSGASTTGEGVTSGASDPTSPGTSPNPTGGSSATGGSSGGSSATGPSTSTSTTGDEPGTASATSPGTSATSTVTSDTSEPPPVEPPVPCAGDPAPLAGVEALAYLKSQIPADPNPSGTGGSSGGGEPDPATLFVRLSDQQATCSDPQGNLACGKHWEVTIAIPPEFQAPGVFNLLGRDVSGGAGETGPADGNTNECAFGGGSFAATFEIVAIDDQAVTGRLCHVDDFFSFVDPQLEGSFVAPRCP